SAWRLTRNDRTPLRSPRSCRRSRAAGRRLSLCNVGCVMFSDYQELIARKAVSFVPRGFDNIPDLHPDLFPHQRAVTEFALRAGCAAMFLDTGLGKSFAALEWGRVVVEVTNKPVLMLAPLAVGPQHEREAKRFGIDAVYVRDGSDITIPRIYITNYERLGNFVVSQFAGVILDESSVIKSFS